ncbi:Pyridoxal-5'-phosphate-dependent protein beta subunit [Desulfatibacillum aliphaticivorans]|uniref:L-serine ammonia-lyase n=1 Tax=Desulfatibacillum aliphaticivorans TaxID=218208 RepID=B8FE99_DESAL|nr:pyridoxal-phosphate dependent enzyme [Desulfatibacillum aliphaticivorans]ACL06880.1 Pyridoxal-5'-phosphate-dependent protein beta subunit [Desulfatibacillum aliphaticivorans]
MPPIHIHTPLLEHRLLSEAIGRKILLKMECLQPPGSFKIRGVGYLCQKAVERGVTHLISSSAGNAGYATAYAGRKLGVKVTVVAPESSSPRARELIQSEKAELIIHGQAWDDAHVRAQECLLDEKCAYVPPFDHPDLWTGHSSLVDELAEQCGKPDAVVLSVGGGGLLCGVLEGMERHGWKDVPVIAAETRGADSFAQSVAQGSLVHLDAITSIAQSLGAKTASQAALDWTFRHEVRPAVVSDKDAVKACLAFAEDRKVLVEPACGASLAAAYDNLRELQDAKTVVVIVCGGIGVTLNRMWAWKKEFGL